MTTDLTTAPGRYLYALETDRLANELSDYIFPPWRWLKWWRCSREVKRRMAILEAHL